MDDIRRDPQYENFVSIYLGLSYVTKQLEPYTKQGLDKTHQDIHQKAAGKVLCQQQCSKVFKGQTSKWCSTCNTWRTYLLKTTKLQKVVWEQTHSWNWPQNSKHIAEVYLPTTWQNKDIDFKDISTACFIWENCKSGFNIRHLIIRKIRKFRNDYFAHNPSYKASEVDKAKVFDVLQDLLNDPDVKGHINVQECIDGLTIIKQGDPTVRWMKEMHDRFDQHEASLALIQRTLEEASLALIQRTLEEASLHQTSIYQQIIRWITLIGLFSLIGMVLIISHKVSPDVLPIKSFPQEQSICQQGEQLCHPYHSSSLPSDERRAGHVASRYSPLESMKGCISEQYTFPFKQDLPLLGYLREHKFLVGRSWLIKELEDEVLYTKNESITALVVVAEMGYGKSALVSNLLCPITSESGSVLHKHIVAFHVCKFDVRSTHYAERFIRRLVGFLAMKSGEYSTIISMLLESNILHDRDSCGKEPEACFDQGITFPLEKISEAENVPWVIVIDALDECEDSGNNQILNILASRMKRLPKWLKFLITTRNITSLHTLRKAKIKYLSAVDSRNKDDIRKFIYQSNTSTKDIDSLIENSDGSFMYIIQASKLIAENQDTVVNLPKNLGDIYEMNFDRQFGKEHSYTIPTIPKKILEIVCSSLDPLNKQGIFTILKYNGVLEDISDFNTYFQSLVFFLRIGRDVQIAHQALYQWLTSEQKNDNYRISLQEGHAQIARYLISLIKNKQKKNLVDLVIHSEKSANSTVQKMFVSSKLIDDADVKRKSYLHQLIWRTSSVNALKLLLSYYTDVDIKNEGKVTPAFVASRTGHIEQLKLLHRKGADLAFSVEGDFTIPAKNVLQNIEMVKQRFYSGYSLLHVAAQHGHTSVVSYLLKHNISIINKTNTLGLNAGETACENGRLDVIEILFNTNPTFIGYKCLFYAAKDNNVTVIDWLFRHGVKFNCVSDRRAEEALKTIFKRELFESSIAVFPRESDSYLDRTVNPVDEWWTVFKINPLHIAIRMGSNDAARYLISNFPDKLNCVDALGYTAALTCVLYNRTEILPLVKEHLVSDRCAKVRAHIENLFPYVSEEIDTRACPDGGGLAHVVALHNLTEVIGFCLQHGLDIEWNKPDSLGNYPIHYAAANKNLMFMVLFKRLQFSHENTRSLNGSTSFHIAAITGQIVFISYFSQSLKFSFPDLRDKGNRGLLHYTVMRHFPDNSIVSTHELQYQSVMLFKYFSDTCNHDLNSLDDYGRNVFHYALRYGHYGVILHFKENQPNMLNTLLYKRDKAGLNPIEYALYQEKPQRFIFPRTCAFFNVFSTQCLNSVNFSRILSPFEWGFMYLTDDFTSSEFFQFLEPNLEHIVKKSVYLLVKVLASYNKHLNVQVLRSILTSTDKHDALMKFKHLAIACYKPEVFHACGEPLSKSPLHFLMLNGEFKSSVFTLGHPYENYFFDFIFRTNRSLFSCDDWKGYNMFHYSLIGGNIMAGRMLMHRNIKTVNKRISLKDVFMLALLSKPDPDPENFMYCGIESFYQSQKDCTDIFLLEYFRTNRKHLLPIDFCRNGTSELSLVHLLSANGMIRTLKIVVDAFGSEILGCINRQNITPLYLSKLFDQPSVVYFIENRVEFALPDKYTEEWLLWLLLHAFPDVHTFENLFCLSHYASFQFLTNRKLLKEFSCVEKIVNTYYVISDVSLRWTQTYIVLILDELRYLFSRFVFFENVFHFHSRNRCSELHLLLNQSYHGLQSFCLLYQTETLYETSLYKTSKRLRQELKEIVGKADIAVKGYLQKKTSDLCFTNDTRMGKGQMIYMYKFATNIFYLMRNWLKEASIHYLMQVTKSMKVKIVGEFSFLRERMRVLKFGLRYKEIQQHTAPLITYSLANFNEFNYMHILKPTLVYEKLKKDIFKERPGINVEYEIKKQEFVDLQEPLDGHQNHSGTAIPYK